MSMGRNICILSEKQAIEVLRNLYQRGCNVRDLERLLGIGKSTIHRVLKGEQKPLAELCIALCGAVSEEELLKILKGRDILMRYDLIDGEGRLNKVVTFALLDALMQDDALKDETLRYLLKYYRKDIQEMFPEVIPKIELKWSEDFEK